MVHKNGNKNCGKKIILLMVGIYMLMSGLQVESRVQDMPIAVDSEGKTSLMHAIVAGDRERVQELVKARPDIINMKDNNGRTALMYAVNWLRFDIVKLLQENGADTTIQDTWGNNAFAYLLNPYTRRDFHQSWDMKGQLLYQLNADGGEWYGCVSWCAKNAYCEESEHVCLGSQCGFRCKTVVVRDECGSCNEPNSIKGEEKMGYEEFISRYNNFPKVKGMLDPRRF